VRLLEDSLWGYSVSGRFPKNIVDLIKACRLNLAQSVLRTSILIWRAAVVYFTLFICLVFDGLRFLYQDAEHLTTLSLTHLVRLRVCYSFHYIYSYTYITVDRDLLYVVYR
jgi:hypothetical protein